MENPFDFVYWSFWLLTVVCALSFFLQVWNYRSIDSRSEKFNAKILIGFTGLAFVNLLVLTLIIQNLPVCLL